MLFIVDLLQGDPYDSSDEEWEHEMVRLYQHPPILEDHTLDAGVDMVNLVAAGFAHADVQDVGDDGGHVVDDGAHGGPGAGDDDEVMAGGAGSNEGYLPEDEPDDMDVSGRHTDGSSVGEDTEESWEEDVGAMAPDTDEDEDEPQQLPIGVAEEDILENDFACTPLYEGSRLSRLGATILLLNTCRVHRCSNNFIDELLRLLAKSVLPSPNHLPTSEYEASKEMKRLGFGYNTIDACVRGCALFGKTTRTLTRAQSAMHLGGSRWEHLVSQGRFYDTSP
jgi:hypothetical protein